MTIIHIFVVRFAKVVFHRCMCVAWLFNFQQMCGSVVAVGLGVLREKREEGESLKILRLIHCMLNVALRAACDKPR